jgi:hypothetical protein
LLILAGYYLLKGLPKIKRHVILIILLVAGFTSMFFAPAAEATTTQASLVSLTLYSVFAALAYWVEWQKSPKNKSWLQVISGFLTRFQIISNRLQPFRKIHILGFY